MPPSTSIRDVSHQRSTDAPRHRSVVGASGGSDADRLRSRRRVGGPGVGQAAGAVEHVRERRGQAERHQAELHDVGVGHRPHAAGHRVGGGDRRRQQDRRGQRHVEQHAEGRADRDQQLGAPEQLAGQRRQEQHRGPPGAEARLERVDERREPEAPHDAREEQAAENQAEAEAQAALDAELNRGRERAFGRAEQVPAIDPRGGHGQRGDPHRHRPPGHDQVGGRAVTGLARRQPAHDQEGGIQRDDGQDRWAHSAWRSRLSDGATGADACPAPAGSP